MIQCRYFQKVSRQKSECSPRLSKVPRLFYRMALMSETLTATETDEQFLARFYQLHERSVRVLLQTQLRNKQIVEDKLHDAQITVLENRALLESIAPQQGRAWLMKVVRNESIDSFRKTRRERELPDHLKVVEEDEFDNLIFIELLEALRDCQNKLESKDQALVQGRYFLGTDCKQLASELSMASNTAVSKRLMIIRKLLELCMTQSRSES